MIDTSIYYITFLRHGESVRNAEDRFQGHADFPLTEKGCAQARTLADRWRDEGVTFDQCIASPLLRTGLTPEQAAQVAPRPDFTTPYTHYGETGESRWEVSLRAGQAIQHILDRRPGGYLVAAHGGVLNMALYAILGIPVQADSTGPRFMFHNTTFATFAYELGHHNWRMLNFDDRRHWKED